MEIKLGGKRYIFTFGFFAVISVYMLLDRDGAGLLALAAVALHELGHVAVMRVAGAKIEAVRFCPFGVRLEKRGMLSYSAEAAVYLGGVAANLAALAVTLPLCGWNAFAYINAALAAFNLLPIGRLDGGVLLSLLLRRGCSLDTAEKVRMLIGFFVLAPIFAAGFWLLLRGNYTLIITAAYLAVTMVRS